jgi:hypothetical protein
VTTAYAILRHNGVVLGKGDFIGLRTSPRPRLVTAGEFAISSDAPPADLAAAKIRKLSLSKPCIRPGTPYGGFL